MTHFDSRSNSTDQTPGAQLALAHPCIGYRARRSEDCCQRVTLLPPPVTLTTKRHGHNNRLGRPLPATRYRPESQRFQTNGPMGLEVASRCRRAAARSRSSADANTVAPDAMLAARWTASYPRSFSLSARSPADRIRTVLTTTTSTWAHRPSSSALADAYERELSRALRRTAARAARASVYPISAQTT